MSRFFRWCMRYGAAILFAFALAQLLVGLIPLISSWLGETGQMVANYSYVSEGSALPIGMQLQVLLSSVSGAILPFLGALVIDRMDRWLTLKGTETRQ